jgi:hypothetical protein
MFTKEIVGGKKTKIKRTDIKYLLESTSENTDLLFRCQAWYDSMSDFRRRRVRNRKYLRGDQWHETMIDPATRETVTEETYISNQGKIPLKQNLMRQLEKNLMGQFRTNPLKSIIIARSRHNAKISEMMSIALESVGDSNKSLELDVRNFEEFVMSGMAIGKTVWKYIPKRNRKDIFNENINPNTIFFNTDVTDIRLTDLCLIGQILDVTQDEIIATFAKNPGDEAKIKTWYNTSYKDLINGNGLSSDRMDLMDFFIPNDGNKCRVFEIWEKKYEWRLYVHDPMDGSYQVMKKDQKNILAQVNVERVKFMEMNDIAEEDYENYLLDIEDKMEPYWNQKFLTPMGQTLYEGETTYAHEEHPYSIVLYPLIDGEVWGLLEDVIDQQRYINRLISLLDFIMGAAAKGVLLVPEDAIHPEFDLASIANEWSKFNGVIKIKSLKQGAQMPQQISANLTNIGAHEMIGIQMKLMQEIFGVSPAMQGQRATSGTPSSLYAQEAQNSTINSKDIMDFYSWYIEQRDYKVMKLIVQFYKEERYINVAGSNYAEESKMFRPELVKDVDLELKVAKGQDTPVYRQMIDDLLFKLLDLQQIDIQMFLENTSLPFADKLLETIKSRQEQLAQGQVPQGGLPPELMAAMQQQAGAGTPEGQPAMSPQTERVMNTLLANARNN